MTAQIFATPKTLQICWPLASLAAWTTVPLPVLRPYLILDIRILTGGNIGHPIDPNHRGIVFAPIVLPFERGANSESGRQWTGEPGQRRILSRLDAGDAL